MVESNVLAPSLLGLDSSALDRETKVFPFYFHPFHIIPHPSITSSKAFVEQLTLKALASYR